MPVCIRSCLLGRSKDAQKLKRVRLCNSNLCPLESKPADFQDLSSVTQVFRLWQWHPMYGRIIESWIKMLDLKHKKRLILLSNPVLSWKGSLTRGFFDCKGTEELIREDFPKAWHLECSRVLSTKDTTWERAHPYFRVHKWIISRCAGSVEKFLEIWLTWVDKALN